MLGGLGGPSLWKRGHYSLDQTLCYYWRLLKSGAQPMLGGLDGPNMWKRGRYCLDQTLLLLEAPQVRCSTLARRSRWRKPVEERPLQSRSDSATTGGSSSQVLNPC
jgi:hypothetical protein